MDEPKASDLIAALPHPAVLIDPRGVIVAANDAAFRHFPQARVGEPAAFAFRDPDIGEAVRRARQGDQRRFEWVDRTPIERAFDVRAAPAGLDHVALTFEDVTERRRTERLRVDFIANVSHELRTPLASVLGFIETVRGAARHDPGAVDRFLGIMEDQAQRMARLVDDLLSLSRIEMLAHVRPTDRVSLVDVARQIVDGMRHRAAEADAELVLSLPQTPVHVAGDRDDIIRALENLVENAIRYGAQGRQIIITIGRRGALEAFVSVRDFGPGIAPEHLPRLTERFYRVNAAASRQNGGTGLGLAIVKHTMLRHRGRLDIESRIGEGSTFSLRFDALD